MSMKHSAVLNDGFRHSHWRNGTRAYSIELCRDLFAHWHVITRWGRYGSRGCQEKKAVFNSRDEGALYYDKQCAKRLKRGYICNAQSE
jgi:predicted DNA-binding WGR domain protein